MKKPLPPNAPINSKRIKKWLNDFGAYRYPVTKQSIEDWLKLFKRPESDTAARLLDVVDFYGQDRIAAAFRKSLKSIDGWDPKPSKRKGQWRFVAYSRSSGESSDGMVYQFRLANHLDAKSLDKMFIYPSEIVLQGLGPNDTIVFVDDFAGTGEQVCEGWKETFAELVAGIGRAYLIVVASVHGARKRIKDQTDLKVVAAHEFDENDNLYSNKCTHFTDPEKRLLLKYNTRADVKHPQGRGESGLVVVFQHRCPNNSLPILHASHNNWTGLFPRHD